MGKLLAKTLKSISQCEKFVIVPLIPKSPQSPISELIAELSLKKS
ncbi:hypothetical protein D1BOALGB6SA_118 [Olavius sp. associated proteobacterium Delta 1]|nr:hypothetical protein D1BOALGB6SA_118 [Olavius sp. associated proteobacterium Delta 1]